jgi:predicted adenine nucleotide alpha hydrolase (AANH) superfamily ATPase
LLHACCGPCAAYPLRELLERSPGREILLWNYNPNIQPTAEWRRRRDALAFLFHSLPRLGLDAGAVTLDLSAPYDGAAFWRGPAGADGPSERCRLCYRLRLRAAAREAAARAYPLFSTTLLFSRQQKHEIIREEALRAQEEFGVKFHYEDFRRGRREGIRLAQELDLYRQNYCGCVLAETDGA